MYGGLVDTVVIHTFLEFWNISFLYIIEQTVQINRETL